MTHRLNRQQVRNYFGLFMQFIALNVKNDSHRERFQGFERFRSGVNGKPKPNTHNISVENLG